MEEIKIEKNVPFPTRFVKSAYPVSKMKVGDSFAVDLKYKSSVRTVVWEYQLRNKDCRFITRTVDDKIRVWRIK